MPVVELIVANSAAEIKEETAPVEEKKNENVAENKEEAPSVAEKKADMFEPKIVEEVTPAAETSVADQPSVDIPVLHSAPQPIVV